MTNCPRCRRPYTHQLTLLGQTVLHCPPESCVPVPLPTAEEREDKRQAALDYGARHGEEKERYDWENLMLNSKSFH